MRVRSLIILLALIGGVAYVWFFQYDWLRGTWRNVKNYLAGYRPAKSPTEAMDQFRKAFKDRDYQAAALYCTGDYAEELERCHDEARTIGQDIDQLLNLLKEKNLDTRSSRALLYYLDPFPPNWKVSGEPKKKGDDKAFGAFEPEETRPTPPDLTQRPLSNVDPRWFSNVLLPRLPKEGVEIRREGSSDDAKWKLNIPLGQPQRDAIKLFRENHGRLRASLEALIDDARRGRYDRGEAFESQIKSTLENGLKAR